MACIKKYFASNGQESLLFNSLSEHYGENRAEEIYLRIHTPEFKAWFGDWEAKKQLEPGQSPPEGFDANMEPAVYWHGSQEEEIESRSPEYYYFSRTRPENDEDAYPVFSRFKPETTNDGTVSSSLIVPKANRTDIMSLFDEKPFKAVSTQIYKSKVTPAEMDFNLRESSNKIQAPTSKDGGYIVGGKEVPRVSHVIDMLGAKYSGTPTGEKYADSGTRYHSIVESIIKGEKLDGYDIQEYEKAFVASATIFIANLKRKGGHLISEFKVASLDANEGKGVAGTVDILHIRPDGTAVLYDLKSANETPSKEKLAKDPWDISDYDYYKAKRYSQQTQLYAKILEKSDDATGRRAIRVSEIHVVPIEIYRNSDETIRHVELRKPENIKEWKSGRRSFSRESHRWASDIVFGKKLKSKLSGIEYGSTVDTFLPKVLGIDFQERDFEKAAKNFVENRSKGHGFKFNDTWYEWVSEDKNERIAQARAILEESQEGHNDRIQTAVADHFKGMPTGPFRSYNTDSSDTQSPAGQRLSKILDQARAVSVKPLSTVKGFESYGDIVLIERTDGSFDMLKMTYESLDRRFNIQHKEKNVLRNATGVNTDSILGNHITPIQAREMKVKLQNTMGDYQRMRMGLVAMELASSDPDIRINRIIVDQLSSSDPSSTYAVPAHEIVQDIQKMYSLPAAKTLADGPIKDLLEKEESYSIVKYQADPVAELIDYMGTQLQDSDFIDSKTKKDNVRAKAQSILRQYQNGEATKDAVVNELLNGFIGLRGLLRSKFAKDDNTENMISSDPEAMLWARVILDLKGSIISPEKDITREFFGFISKFIKSPAHTGRQTADKAYDWFRQYYDDIKHETQNFIHEKNPRVNELIRESTFLKRGMAMGPLNVGGSDTVFAMGMSVFENLFQRGKTPDGRSYLLPMLVAEGSEDFKKLSVAEQKFITYFNDVMTRYNPKWVRGTVPLISVSPNTLLYRSKRDLGSAQIEKSARELKDSVATALKRASSRGNYQVDETPGSNLTDYAHDFFSGLINENGEYKLDTLNRYGLDENMALIDPAKNDGFETNLELIMTRFATHYIKKKHIDKALPAYHVMRSIFKLYEMAYGLNQKDTIESLDYYIKDLAFNEKQSEDTVITNIVNIGVRSSSVALLGLNPKVFFANATQMFTAGWIDSFTNTLAKDPRFPGIQHFAKAATILIQAVNPTSDYKTAAMLNLMKETYLPDDLTVMTGDKNMKTASGMVNTQVAFAMDRMTEYTVRTQHLIAQMLKDGCYDAHDAIQEVGPDGNYRWKLVYDPKKDKRFQGEEGKMLYEAIKRSQEEKGELTDKGEISMAYDWHLRNRLAAYINLQIGTFDKDLSSHMHRFSLFYALSQFRSWFRDKYQRTTKLEYQSETMGDFVRVGNEVKWASETMKGILWTLVDLPTIAKNLVTKKGISRADKRNLIYAMNSTAAMALAMALVAAAWDDEDEMPDFMAGQVNRYYGDVMAFATMEPFLNITVNPVTFISYYQRLFESLSHAVSYKMQGDDEKSRRALLNAVPPIIAQTLETDE